MSDTSPILHADTDPKFFSRFFWLGLAALGFSAYCVYDGAIGYPYKIERATEYNRLKEADRADEWEAFALEQGWSTDLPGKLYTQYDIYMQYIMAAAAGSVGLAFLTVFFRSKGRWIEADAEGVTSSWGGGFRFDQVVGVEKRKWKDKGIARVHYQDGTKRRKFVLDNFKFERFLTTDILRRVESHLPVEKIIGGRPEADLGEVSVEPMPETAE